MGREILFHGKRVDNDEWVYGFLRCGNYIDVWTPHTWKDEDGSTGEYVTVETYQVDPKTVGQYIGLTDKNSKKIFEGDILCYTWDTLSGEKKPYTYVISYNNKEARFIGKCDSDNLQHLLPTFEYVGERSEVVGNVYDNPELLEVEND